MNTGKYLVLEDQSPKNTHKCLDAVYGKSSRNATVKWKAREFQCGMGSFQDDALSVQPSTVQPEKTLRLFIS